MTHKNTRRGFTQNVIFCPPCGEQSLAPEGFNPGVSVATKEGQNRKNALWPLLPRLSAVLPPQGREMFHGFTQSCHPEFISGSSRYNNKMLKPVQHDGIKGFTLARSVTPQGRHAGYSGRIGFTLIELLVVVLIIGILAAVAVPQYQRAIDMLRITRALEMSKILAYAETVYYLSNDTYTKDLSKLDVDLGECTCTNTSCTVWNCNGYSVWISDMGTVIDLNKSWTGGDVVRVEYYLVERKKGWRVGYASTERFQNIWTKKLGGVPMQGNPGYFRLSANW